MEAVTVAEVVVALEPLRPLTQGPTLHVRLVVLLHGLLEQSDGSLVVASVVQPHRCCEGALRRREKGTMGRVFMTFGAQQSSL